ncbi:LysR substrate-binding domain-containing protein [Streptomyces chartreusis]
MFDLHRLRLLRELKHRGTLAAVASGLSYSPSTISQQLSRLESEVGVQLLEPAGRCVRLTAQADILVAHTEAVLAQLDQAAAEIAISMVEVTGTVRIASFQTAALSLIPATLELLRDIHPLLHVRIIQMEGENAVPALMCRDVDLIIDVEYPRTPRFRHNELDQEDLCTDTLQLAHLNMPSEAAPQEALREMAKHPWVMEPEGTDARCWSMKVCREAGFEPDVRYESADKLVHLALVEQGHAAAFMPSLAWRGSPPSVPLAPLPSHLETRRLSTAVRQGSGRHPAVQAVRQALLHASAENPNANRAPVGRWDGVAESA